MRKQEDIRRGLSAGRLAAGQKIVKIGKDYHELASSSGKKTGPRKHVMPENSIPLGPMDHLALLTTDPVRGERFYCDVLGFHAVPRPSFSFDGRWLVHEAVGVMLHLIHREDHQPSGEGLNTLNPHFAISCQDIDGAIARLKQQGIDFVEKRLPDYGYRQVFFRDPDGNLLELGEWPRRD